MIRVAVCGVGHWGRNYLRVLSGIGECQLVGFADINPNNTEQIGLLYPHLIASSDPDEVICSDSVDAVIVATPPETHVALCTKALRHGKHVLVEKPIAFSTKEVKKLFLIANEEQKILMVGHIMEYHPAIETIKQVIEAKRLGEIRFILMSRTHLNDLPAAVGALWDLAVHDLSMIRYIFGACPCSITAKGIGSHLPGLEAVFIYLGLQLGTREIPVFINVSQITPGKCRKIKVIGRELSAEFDDTLVEKSVRLMNMNETILLPVSMVEPLAAECRHFFECILYGKNPRTSLEDALWVTNILEKAQESLDNDNPSQLIG
ncbi:MAG: Gfo/Idh/MocA family oxidoreductase [Heliobacteriaceae bacterium]|nr:Gfo/Idh/MocA family oxidoreductase [Heliobacteriaceae bacterium]MDD4587599.1 Gfo/Idh/MocA family oxidoreductase [Heliobacteriaceae bacterium]